MRKVKVTIPASTTNLGSGFDCLGLALTLYNSVEVEWSTRQGVFIQVEGEGKGFIDIDTRNIIFPALKKVFEKMGRQLPGINIKQINRIPIGKGLGSSAATRLGGIIAANQLLGANLSPAEVLKMATKLEGHADNAAASLLGGLVAIANTDNDSLWIKLNVPEDLRVVMVIPELKILTQKARQVLPHKISLSDALFNLSRVAVLVPSLTQGKWNNLALTTQDRLHQPYRTSLLPGMQEVFKAALTTGAKGVFLSGAGSGIAAFTLNKEMEVAQAMQEAFLKKGVRSDIMVLSVDREGVQIDEEE